MIGKVYSNTIDNSGKAVLVFGIAERKSYSVNPHKDGIGVDLDTGKIETVSEFSSELTRFSDLTDRQLENFSHYFSIYKKMSDNALLAITGKARSGKDTLAREVIRSFGDFTQTALGDPIRRVHNVIYGDSIGKDRGNLILIGQGLRKEDPHIWIKTWLRHAIESIAYQSTSKLIISDIRQPNEFTFFKSMGALTVRIDADEEKRLKLLAEIDGKDALGEKLLNDETESHVFDADVVVFNEYDETYFDEIMKVTEKLK